MVVGIMSVSWIKLVKIDVGFRLQAIFPQRKYGWKTEIEENMIHVLVVISISIIQ